jgi:hypothetical protein
MMGMIQSVQELRRILFISSMIEEYEALKRSADVEYQSMESGRCKAALSASSEADYIGDKPDTGAAKYPRPDDCIQAQNYP